MGTINAIDPFTFITAYYLVFLQEKYALIKIGNIELPDFPLLLAPMEDVIDSPYRILCKMHGADMVYSEFISSEGLIRDAIKSRMKLDIFGQILCFVNFVLLEVFNSYLLFVFLIPFRRFCRQGD